MKLKIAALVTVAELFSTAPPMMLVGHVMQEWPAVLVVWLLSGVWIGALAGLFFSAILVKET